MWAEIVVVRPVSALDDWRGRDAEWQLGQDRGLEDALRAQERHALALEDEALGEQRGSRADRGAVPPAARCSSPVEPYLPMKDEEIVAAVIADLKRQGIDVEGRVRQFAVVRHPSEFYLLEPGSEARRPASARRSPAWRSRATTPSSRSSAAWKAPSSPAGSPPKPSWTPAADGRPILARGCATGAPGWVLSGNSANSMFPV